MISIFKKLFDTEYKELKRFNEIAAKIDALDGVSFDINEGEFCILLELL